MYSYQVKGHKWFKRNLISTPPLLRYQFSCGQYIYVLFTYYVVFLLVCVCVSFPLFARLFMLISKLKKLISKSHVNMFFHVFFFVNELIFDFSHSV